MEMSEAQGQFGLADDFFSRGRYAEAIGLLEGLEPHFPNNHRLLNAKARTLAEMGMLEPALEICDRLLIELHYEKIRQFRNELAAAVDLAGAKGNHVNSADPLLLPKTPGTVFEFGVSNGLPPGEMFEAQDRFERADGLFNEGQYAEALGLLEELESRFPNNHRLLNAKARTLAEMGELQPALDICDRLLTEFHYEKIRLFRNELAAVIDKPPPPPKAPDLAAAEITPDAIVGCPDVNGMATGPAETALEEAGFSVSTETDAYSDDVPVGSTIEQYPVADVQVAPNTDVDLVISEGPKTVCVPDVAGMAKGLAETALDEAGLSIGKGTEAYSETVAVGSVISQKPVADAQVSPGTVVDLVISKGPKTVPVPDVAGMARGLAETALVEAGLSIGKSKQAHSETVPVGNVISQKPVVNRKVTPGTRVNLVISKGPKTVPVPDVAGMAKESAEAALGEAGLSIGKSTEAYSETVSVGNVISQKPVVNRKVTPGTRVNLVISKGPKTVPVPDVAGMAKESAEAALGEAGLSIGKSTEAYSETGSVGNVISQKPVVNRKVTPGTRVNLVISKGPKTVPVPDVAGMAKESAEAALGEAGLSIGKSTEAYSETVPVGSIIAQYPVKDLQVALGTAVDLVISKGPKTVPVPDVTGMAKGLAETALDEAGLSVGRSTEAYSETVPVGNVISQDPVSDLQVAPGTSVDLVISKGLQPVSVPDVAGMAKGLAETALEEAGLSAGTETDAYSDDIPVGSIIAHYPVADLQVTPGTAVDLVISKGPQPVCVPDVAGMAEGSAQTTLGEAGLGAGKSTESYSETVAVGIVISQDPVADTQVVPGTAVDLVVSKGPKAVSVPDVAGMVEASAKTALDEAGFSAGKSTRAYSETVTLGNVISQDPVADTQVAPGTAVDLVVSKGPQPVVDATASSVDKRREEIVARWSRAADRARGRRRR